MFDENKFREMQRSLFMSSNGKTTAIVATALQVAEMERKTVQVVASSLDQVSHLRDMGVSLAKELGIPVETLTSRRLMLLDGEPTSIYFVHRGSMLRGMDLTFYDHNVLVSSNVCLGDLFLDLDS